MRLKVLIVAHVGETVGHLVRAISVARRLSALGVSVQLACTAQARKMLRDELSGLKVHEIRWNWSHNGHAEQAWSAYHRSIEDSNRDLLQLLDHERPELLLSIPGVFTAQAAQSRGIRHISVLHGPYLSPILARQEFTTTERNVLDFATQLMTGGRWDSIFAHLSRTLNLPSLTYEGYLLQESIVVAQPGLDVSGFKNMSQCDFILGSYGLTSPQLQLPAESCYVTFGSGNPCDINSIVDAAARQFSRVVVSTGFANNVMPRKNVLVRPSIPSSQLADSVGAVISHGGIGTVGAFAASGAAQLIIPTEVDQATMAVHAPRLGVASECGLESWAAAPRWGRMLPTISQVELDEAVSELYKKSLSAQMPLLRNSGAEQVAHLIVEEATQ